MPNSMELFSCAICGNVLTFLEWQENSANLKDFKCPDCDHLLNQDELYGENGASMAEGENDDVSNMSGKGN